MVPDVDAVECGSAPPKTLISTSGATAARGEVGMAAGSGPDRHRRTAGAVAAPPSGRRCGHPAAGVGLKLSRLENGQSAPQQRDVRDLINFYGADRATDDNDGDQRRGEG